LKDIKVKSLLINAQNDPMLPSECFPFDLARDHAYFFLEAPEKGGHVGFTPIWGQYAWSEIRALEFIESIDS
jgi:predicted alpha/beta-fold hydrolase